MANNTGTPREISHSDAFAVAWLSATPAPHRQDLLKRFEENGKLGRTGTSIIKRLMPRKTARARAVRRRSARVGAAAAH